MRCGFFVCGARESCSLLRAAGRECSLGREGTFAEQVCDRCRGLYLGK